MLEDKSKEKHLYTKNTPTLVCGCQYTMNHRTFKRHDITKTQKNVKDGVCSYEINPMTLFISGYGENQN